MSRGKSVSEKRPAVRSPRGPNPMNASTPIFEAGERMAFVEVWDPANDSTCHWSCSVCGYTFASLIRDVTGPFRFFRVKTEQHEGIVCLACSEILGVAAWRIRGE